MAMVAKERGRLDFENIVDWQVKILIDRDGAAERLSRNIVFRELVGLCIRMVEI